MKWNSLCRDAHMLLVGGTGRGKSGLLQLITRAIISEGVEGLIALDPHGSYVRSIVEWAATPGRIGSRGIEFFEFGSDHSWSLNPLDTHGVETPEAYHEAARDLIAVVENFFDAPAEQTPRLLRILYICAYLCSAKKLSPIEMCELLSLGGEMLREALISYCENRVVTREAEELCALARKHPARFSEITESARNRWVTLVGDRRIARALGGPRSINAFACMQNRERLLFDLSAIPTADCRFIGALITKVFMSAAQRRVPDRAPPCRLILDEANDLMCKATSDMVATTRKYRLYLICSLQYLGQAEAKHPYLLEGLLTNCDVKVVMGGLPPEQAKMMAEILCSPFDVQKFKPNSVRPTAIGNQLRMLKSSSEAEHHAQHDMRGVTSMRSAGRSRTTANATSVTTSETESYQRSDGYSEGASAALGTAKAKGTGTHAQEATSHGLMLTPPDEESFFPADPTALGQTQGSATGKGSSVMQSDAASTMLASSSLFSSTDSEGYASSEAYSESESEAETESESEGTAESVAQGTSVGRSAARGVSETFVTKYALLATSMFTLDELLHLAMAEVMTLPRRGAIIRVSDQRAFRTRTADLTPAFNRALNRSLLLPLFRRSLLVRSKWLLPTLQVDCEIAARLKALTAAASKPDAPAFAPVPIVTDPTGYAKGFSKRRIPTPHDEPPKPIGRKPQGKFRRDAGPLLGIVDGVDNDNA